MEKFTIAKYPVDRTVQKECLRIQKGQTQQEEGIFYMRYLKEGNEHLFLCGLDDEKMAKVFAARGLKEDRFARLIISAAGMILKKYGVEDKFTITKNEV